MPDIRHYVEINAPVTTVYRAVTEQKGLAGWWTQDTVIQPGVGAVAQFRFGPRYHNKMKVVRLDPGRKVEWECREGDKEWVGTRFVFDLEERNGITILRFAQNGWREATDFYAICNFTWAQYMLSLKAYCEMGKGAPFPKG
ncbi:MAG: SRPBCC domain-containing protein [candidate division Zixibacteria bacterium]|nr:SRPBCC domain-containing protein [candidate division Zixibacteria bacterium]